MTPPWPAKRREKVRPPLDNYTLRLSPGRAHDVQSPRTSADHRTTITPASCTPSAAAGFVPANAGLTAANLRAVAVAGEFFNRHRKPT